MDRMLYVAMSGAKQIMNAQAVNSHNLANVNTTGFREHLTEFESRPVSGQGFPTRIYATLGSGAVNQTPGATIPTGRDMDVAVSGPGWIVVQSESGTEGLTRDGNLKVSPEGTLVTAGDRIVIGGSGGAITIPPFEKIDIGEDGTISILPAGQTPEALVVIDRLKLVNPGVDDIAQGNDGLMYSKDHSILPADSEVRLVSGALEGSNVNAVDAMVKMIALARQFEMEVKLMKTSEDLDSAASQLVRIS